MASFEVGDVVAVPFPYTDRPVRQRRPAFVAAADALTRDHGLLWVMMITSAENRRWATDVPITDLEAAGLPAASVVRTAKIATIEERDATRLGTLRAADRQRVARHLANRLATLLGTKARNRRS